MTEKQIFILLGWAVGFGLSLYVGTAPQPDKIAESKRINFSQIATSMDGELGQAAKAERVQRIYDKSTFDAEKIAEITALLLPKFRWELRRFQNVQSNYDLARDTLVLTGDIPYPGFAKIPDWKVSEDLEVTKQKLCKRYSGNGFYRMGLALEFNLRTQKEDLTIGSILLSKTECRA